MDLQLYLRVMWRFRLLMAAGAVVGLLLAGLSLVRLDPSGDGPTLQFREEEQWVSYATLFVTQQGFPWGEVQSRAKRIESGPDRGDLPGADPNRFSTLAVLYSELATSDQVRKIMLRQGPLHGEIDAAPVMASDDAFAGALPLIRIAAIADTPDHALTLVMRSTDAFKSFLEQEQIRTKIPENNRVRVTIVKRAEKPLLLAGRSLTLPIVVFICVMVLVSALAFILENFRPRIRPVAAESEPARRTA